MKFGNYLMSVMGWARIYQNTSADIRFRSHLHISSSYTSKCFLSDSLSLMKLPLNIYCHLQYRWFVIVYIYMSCFSFALCLRCVMLFIWNKSHERWQFMQIKMLWSYYLYIYSFIHYLLSYHLISMSVHTLYWLI